MRARFGPAGLRTPKIAGMRKQANPEALANRVPSGGRQTARDPTTKGNFTKASNYAAASENSATSSFNKLFPVTTTERIPPGWRGGHSSSPPSPRGRSCSCSPLRDLKSTSSELEGAGECATDLTARSASYTHADTHAQISWVISNVINCGSRLCARKHNARAQIPCERIRSRQDRHSRQHA